MAYRVLLADDDWFTVRLLAYHLQARGYDVVCAGNGQEAWAAIKESPPDLIITDWAMPLLDGLELTACVRASAATRDVPIVIVSAKADHLTGSRDLDWLRITAFRPKPFDPAEVANLVETILVVPIPS
jgi:two-component system, OmpR family, phosphate regulon response regulator PhoB